MRLLQAPYFRHGAAGWPEGFRSEKKGIAAFASARELPAERRRRSREGRRRGSDRPVTGVFEGWFQEADRRLAGV